MGDWSSLLPAVPAATGTAAARVREGERAESSEMGEWESEMTVNLGQHGVHLDKAPGARWTIELPSPTCQGSQTMKSLRIGDGMASEANKFGAVAPVTARTF
jgi:hypothetical protein